MGDSKTAGGGGEGVRRFKAFRETTAAFGNVGAYSMGRQAILRQATRKLCTAFQEYKWPPRNSYTPETDRQTGRNRCRCRMPVFTTQRCRGATHLCCVRLSRPGVLLRLPSERSPTMLISKPTASPTPSQPPSRLASPARLRPLILLVLLPPLPLQTPMLLSASAAA